MPEKVMVVDDDKDILEVVAQILTMHGFEPVLINNGNDLLTKVNEFRPAVILLDVQLGGLDGRVFCKQLKEIEEHSHTAIILFSANTHYKEDVHQYLCDDFIEKPFDMAMLIDKISHYIQRNDKKISLN